ncbi:hypothetical protein HDE76_000349 [Rhodanobacter sp. ANJX3]|nr:hypothetical protein [Rhodanobacter sp. ANJX3]
MSLLACIVLSARLAAAAAKFNDASNADAIQPIALAIPPPLRLIR